MVRSTFIRTWNVFPSYLCYSDKQLRYYIFSLLPILSFSHHLHIWATKDCVCLKANHSGGAFYRYVLLNWEIFEPKNIVNTNRSMAYQKAKPTNTQTIHPSAKKLVASGAGAVAVHCAYTHKAMFKPQSENLTWVVGLYFHVFSFCPEMSFGSVLVFTRILPDIESG